MKNSTKKIFSILLMIILLFTLCFSFTGCKSSEETNIETNNHQSTVSNDEKDNNENDNDFLEDSNMTESNEEQTEQNNQPNNNAENNNAMPEKENTNNNTTPKPNNTQTDKKEEQQNSSNNTDRPIVEDDRPNNSSSNNSSQNNTTIKDASEFKNLNEFDKYYSNENYSFDNPIKNMSELSTNCNCGILVSGTPTNYTVEITNNNSKHFHYFNFENVTNPSRPIIIGGEGISNSVISGAFSNNTTKCDCYIFATKNKLYIETKNNNHGHGWTWKIKEQEQESNIKEDIICEDCNLIKYTDVKNSKIWITLNLDGKTHTHTWDFKRGFGQKYPVIQCNECGFNLSENGGFTITCAANKETGGHGVTAGTPY